jgi:hypothetical protein
LLVKLYGFDSISAAMVIGRLPELSMADARHSLVMIRMQAERLFGCGCEAGLLGTRANEHVGGVEGQGCCGHQSGRGCSRSMRTVQNLQIQG